MIWKILLLAVITQATAILAQAQGPGVELRLLAFDPSLRQKVYAHDPLAPDAAASVPGDVKSYLNHQFMTVPLKSRKVVFTTKPDRGSLTRTEDLVAETALPDGVNSAILVFLPAPPNGKGTSQIMAINDAKRAFPAGSFHVSNLSPYPVRVMLETKGFNFNPGQAILIQDPPVREGMQSGMRTFAFKNEKWEPIATGLWPHPGETRSVMVLFKNPTGEVQLRAFDDIRPRDPAAASAPTQTPAN